MKNLVVENRYKFSNDVYECQVCLKNFDKKRSVIEHYKSHSKNFQRGREKAVQKMKDKWGGPPNKGLSLKTHPELRDRLTSGARGLAKRKAEDPEFKKRMDQKRKEVWTPELRKAQSERKKKLYKDFPEKHPNRILAGNRSRLSYPESLCMAYLEEYSIPFISQFSVKNRFADFYLPEKNLIVEIDGDYWHNDEKDREKDELYRDSGFRFVRLKAKKVLRQLEDILRAEGYLSY